MEIYAYHSLHADIKLRLSQDFSTRLETSPRKLFIYTYLELLGVKLLSVSLADSKYYDFMFS